MVASKANACRKLLFAVTWKGAQNRYKRLQECADDADKTETLTSSISGEVDEAEELLSAMREARDAVEQPREEKRRVMG